MERENHQEDIKTLKEIEEEMGLFFVSNDFGHSLSGNEKEKPSEY